LCYAARGYVCKLYVYCNYFTTYTDFGVGQLGNRIPVGARFSSPIQTGPRGHPAPYTMDTGSFPGLKRSGRGVNYSPHLAPRLKKECSYTSTPLKASSTVNFIFTIVFLLTVIFTRAAPKPAHNNGCGPLPKKAQHALP
jgi:hypothetical protein